MRLSDLQNKDIVNLLDGTKIGNIIDVKIEEETGKILKIVVEQNKGVKSFFANSAGETEIDYSSITKIGTDVILVKF